MNDYGKIIRRVQDGSYVIGNGTYHVPNPATDASANVSEWQGKWDDVNEYARAHPENVTEEQPPAPHVPTEEETRAMCTAAIQAALDEFAKTRGYDGIISACSYATSTDATFKAEAAYCVMLRDATWRAAYGLLDAVRSGLREAPANVPALIAELPVGAAAWPEV